MINTIIKDIPLQFETMSTSFSPGCIDRGTLAMLSIADFAPEDKVLDLGCGYGVVGILTAKLIGTERVFMSDIEQTAVDIALKNAFLNGVPGIQAVKSDGFRDITEKDFTVILSNPPYHTDFSVAKHFIEKGFNRLAIGGRMYMVTKRKDWYKNKLTAIFGGTAVHEIDGYYIFCSQKRTSQYSSSGDNNSSNSRKP